jgi:hypothetical protein
VMQTAAKVVNCARGGGYGGRRGCGGSAGWVGACADLTVAEMGRRTESSCGLGRTCPAVLKLMPVMARRRPTELKAEEEGIEEVVPWGESSMVACRRTKRYQTQLAGISGALDLGHMELLGLLEAAGSSARLRRLAMPIVESISWCTRLSTIASGSLAVSSAGSSQVTSVSSVGTEST